MKIGIVRRISKEDLNSKELPAWLDPLLVPINQFITTVVTALTGRLTFEDNFSAKVLSFKFVHDTELVINPQNGRLSVVGVLPSYSGGAVVTGFGWTHRSDGTLGVTFQFDDSGTHTCKLIILLGAS